MSDEIHMEAAWRHRDLSAGEQWHAKSPADNLMEMEEYEPGAAGEGFFDRVALLRAMVTYLFSDGRPEEWRMVAVRCHAVMLQCTPGTLMQRQAVDLEPLRRVWAERRSGEARFELNTFVRLCEDNGEDFRKVLGEVLDYIYPDGRNWLFKGAQRAYLVALAYQPTAFGRRVTYEDLARIFEGEALTTRQARSRARSRWSARAQEVLRRPIEAAGGKAGLQFSKSAGARKKMSASAQGNKNRLGGRAERKPCSPSSEST